MFYYIARYPVKSPDLGRKLHGRNYTITKCSVTCSTLAVIVDRVNDALIQAFAVAPRGTAARIARELDVAPQTVSKWASGSILPEQHRWPDLERLLGLDDGALMAAHRAAAEIKRPDDHIPPAVSEAIGRLGDELRNLRGEVSALRSEVDELRGERHGSARSSDRSRRAAGTTSDREGP